MRRGTPLFPCLWALVLTPPHPRSPTHPPQTKSHLYIILEYVENGSLSNIIKPNRFGVFPESLVAVYIAQVLEGLAYLHEQGVIHRDIKGANILTTKEGLVKLADFGVATRLVGEAGDGPQAVESTALVAGTPYWMAPEVIEMAGVSPASDIWSVGCTIIELLTGSPPYFDLNPMTALFRIVQDACPPIPEGISPALDNLLRQCFAKQPRNRPTARQLLHHEWLTAMRKDIKHSWPRTRKSRGGAAVQEGVATVVERMLEHESSASSVSGSGVGLAGPPSAGGGPGDRPGSTALSGPPSPEHTWHGQHHRAGSSSHTPSSRRTLDALGGSGAAGLSGWATNSQGSLTLTGEPSAGRSLHVPPQHESSAASRSALLFGLSAAGEQPNRGTSLLQAEVSMPRSVGGSDVAGPAGVGGPYHQASSSRSTSELWHWLAGTADAGGDRGVARGSSAAASAQLVDPRASAARVPPLYIGLAHDSPPGSTLPGMEDASPGLVHSELEAEAVRQMGLLTPGSRDVILTAACERLEGLLSDTPQVIIPLIATSGAAPLIHVLDAQPPSPPVVMAAALRLVAAACAGRPAVAEHLCALGVLPRVLLATSASSTPAVRAAAAAVLRAVVSSGGPPVSMLTACRGLSAVASLLECQPHSGGTGPGSVNVAMVGTALDCLWRVLEQQACGPFPGGHAWSRQCAQAGVLERLAAVLACLAAQCSEARHLAASQAARQQEQQQRPVSRTNQRAGRHAAVSGAAQVAAAAAAADAAEAAATEGDSDSCFSQLRSAAELWLAFARCDAPDVVAHCAADAVLAGVMPLLAAYGASTQAQGLGPSGGTWLPLLILRGLRALSAHSETLEPMQRAGAIPALVPFLAHASLRRPADTATPAASAAQPVPGSAAPIRSLSAPPQQTGSGRLSSGSGGAPSPSTTGGAAAPPPPAGPVPVALQAATDALHALSNLCRLHATRAEQAATAGVIPSLVRLSHAYPATLEAPALGLLCAMAHASRRARAELARHDCGRVYLHLLSRPAGSPWPLAALEALGTWLASEPWQLEPLLLDGDEPAEALVALAGRHAQAAPPALVRLLDGLTRVTGHSPRMAQQLASAGLVPRALEAAGHGDPGVRLGALKLLRALYEQHPAPKELIARHDLANKLGAIAAAERDGDAVLVRSAAQALLDALGVNDAL